MRGPMGEQPKKDAAEALAPDNWFSEMVNMVGATQHSSHTKPERVEVGQRWNCPHGVHPEYVMTRWVEQLQVWEASPFTHWTAAYLMADCTFLGWAPGFGPDCQLSAAEGRSNSLLRPSQEKAIAELQEQLGVASPGNTWEVSANGDDWFRPEVTKVKDYAYRRLLSPEGRVLEEHGSGVISAADAEFYGRARPGGQGLRIPSRQWGKTAEAARTDSGCRAEPGGQLPVMPMAKRQRLLDGTWAAPGEGVATLDELRKLAGQLSAPEGRTQPPGIVSEIADAVQRISKLSVPTPVGTEKTEPVVADDAMGRTREAVAEYNERMRRRLEDTPSEPPKAEPRKHDWSNPYLVRRSGQRRCVECGTDQPPSEGESWECSPQPGWRAHHERNIAIWTQEECRLSPADCGPSQTLPSRQSQAIGAGLGVWSLREENASRKRGRRA